MRIGKYRRMVIPILYTGNLFLGEAVEKADKILTTQISNVQWKYFALLNIHNCEETHNT